MTRLANLATFIFHGKTIQMKFFRSFQIKWLTISQKSNKNCDIPPFAYACFFTLWPSGSGERVPKPQYADANRGTGYIFRILFGPMGRTKEL